MCSLHRRTAPTKRPLRTSPGMRLRREPIAVDTSGVRLHRPTVRRRPPVASPAQLVGFTALLLYGLLFGEFWLVIFVAFGALWWLATWALAPYSRFAFHQRQPGPEQFERYRRLAERMKAMPVLGPVVRWGDRRSGGLGWTISAEYEKWIRDHGVEDPGRKEE